MLHVVALAGDALDRCRQRAQQHTCRHRGRTGDPLYGIRRVLRTGVELLTDKQHTRLKAVLADNRHVEVEATWGVYQATVAAYRAPKRADGKAALSTVIASISRGVPTELSEIIRLGHTLARRADDVLAYFTFRKRATAPPRPSTAASNTSVAPHWLPEPAQLHRKIVIRHRRLQRAGRLCARCGPVWGCWMNPSLNRTWIARHRARRELEPSQLNDNGVRRLGRSKTSSPITRFDLATIYRHFG